MDSSDKRQAVPTAAQACCHVASEEQPTAALRLCVANGSGEQTVTRPRASRSRRLAGGLCWAFRLGVFAK